MEKSLKTYSWLFFSALFLSLNIFFYYSCESCQVIIPACLITAKQHLCIYNVNKVFLLSDFIINSIKPWITDFFSKTMRHYAALFCYRGRFHLNRGTYAHCHVQHENLQGLYIITDNQVIYYYGQTKFMWQTGWIETAAV